MNIRTKHNMTDLFPDVIKYSFILSIFANYFLTNTYF